MRYESDLTYLLLAKADGRSSIATGGTQGMGPPNGRWVSQRQSSSIQRMGKEGMGEHTTDRSGRSVLHIANVVSMSRQ